MNVLAIISRDLEKGSTKYRIVQYLDFLRSKGINVEFVNRKSIDKSVIKRSAQVDIVFNQKCLFRYSLAGKLIAASRRTLFDFDDAIYTRPGKPDSLVTRIRVRRRLHLWLQRSDIVTTSNHFLARYARQYSDSVEIIPMALDLETWKPLEKSFDNNITIGWTGAPVNIPLIESLDPVLTFLLKKFPFLKLAVFSGQKPKLNCPFEYHPFRRNIAVYLMRKIRGENLNNIGEQFNIKAYSTVSIILRRVSRLKKYDRKIKKRIGKIQDSINKGQT